MDSMQAAIYLRQSEDRNGNMLAVDRQRQDCEKLCAQKGWVTTEYMDNDTSASNGKTRPDYQRMLADIRDGRIDAVVAWDLDRLYRQPRELEDLIDLADQKHLALATVGGEADLSTDNGRLFARIKGAVAKSETDRKSARQKRAAQQRAEAGTPGRSTVPFGYRQAGDALELEPAEAMMVRDAYSAILAGVSLHAITRQWNTGNVPTRRGNRWSGATVRQVLMAWRNAGVAVYKGEPVGEGAWPAIVDRDVFDGVRAGWFGGRDQAFEQAAEQGRSVAEVEGGEGGDRVHGGGRGAVVEHVSADHCPQFSGDSCHHGVEFRFLVQFWEDGFEQHVAEFGGDVFGAVPHFGARGHRQPFRQVRPGGYPVVHFLCRAVDDDAVFDEPDVQVVRDLGDVQVR